jgi:ATP/maltotriose-dependent transcriptional regulator MalT
MTRTPADLRLLRARAARILAAAKETEAAIDLCIGGGLHRLALSLLTRAAPRLLRSGRSHFIREKFDALPKALLQHATLARFWLGIACQVAESGRAVVLLEGAYNDFAAKGNLRWQIKAVSALVHSRIYSARPMVELRGWIPIIERLRLRIGERHARHHVTLLAALVYASFYAKPDHPRLRAWALELDAQLGSISNPTDRLLGALHLVTYYTWSGDLDHARSLVQRIGPLNDNAAQSPALRLYAQSRVVLLYAFDADYARARDVLHAMRLAVATDGLELMVLGCVFFEAMVGWLEGDLTAAAQAIGQIGRWAGERNLNLAVNVHQVLALNCISSHRPELARAHSMMAIRAADTSGIQWFRAVARLTRAYAECAGGRFDLARRLLRVVRVLISRTPYEHFEVECRMIEVSIELQRQGVTPTVLKHLADTLYQAERSSPIFAFRAVPLGLPYLLNVARRHAIAPNYSRRLEQKFWPDRRMPECGIVAAPRPRVEVFLLGKFQVRVDGEVLAFGKKTPRRSLSVIAACAAYGTGGHPCTRSSMTFGPNRRDQRSNSLFAQPCGACARSYQWSTRLSIATACSQLIGTWYGSMQLRPSMRSNK